MRHIFIFVATASLLSACGSMDEPASVEAFTAQSNGGTGSGGNIAPDPIQHPPANQGDNYEAVGTNAFVIAESDPWSTFAADVDTASYDIFRRDIQELNAAPQAAGVRLEEYVNYFEYAYPAPETTSDTPFTISMQGAPSPFVPGTTVVRVGIKGRPLADLAEKDANIVFLIDASGSMGGAAKLPLVKETLTAALDVFQPTDSVSIVTYGGGAGLALAPTAASEKGTIATVINALASGGGTPGAAGINLAYEQAESAFIEGGINHVVLCTDGDFNVGVSSTTGLVELIEEKRKSGITLTVLGFGAGNLNDIMMEKVSNAGNGTYSLVTNQDDAIAYAHNRLLPSMYFIAKDMKIQTVFNPKMVHAYRLLGYEINDIADELFEDDTVDAGEVGAGHTVTALYEVVAAGGEIPQPDGAPEPEDGEPFEGELAVEGGELVRVVIRYKDVDAGEEDEAFEVSAGLAESDVLDTLDAADADFRWAAAIAAFAEILKDSPYADAANIATIDAIVAADPKSTYDREEFELLYTQTKTMLGL